MVPNRLVPALFALLGAAVFPGDALSQSQDPADEPAAAFREDVEVELVNIDVLVTDRRGQPITTLQAEDFEVRENAVAMEVEFFRAPRNERPDRRRREPSDREWTEGPGQAPNLQNGPESRVVAFYVDLHGTNPGNVDRVTARLAEYLEVLEDGESIRYLVATADPELHVREPLSTSPSQLARTVAELARERVTGAYDDGRLRMSRLLAIGETFEGCLNVETRFAQCEPCEEPWAHYLQEAHTYRAEMESRAHSAIGNLAELVTALGGIPGRKTLIYFGESLTLEPGAEIFHYLGEICPDRQRETYGLQMQFNSTSLFNRFGSFSNANRVTLYPIDAAGIRSLSAGDVRFTGQMTTTAGRTSESYRLGNSLIPSSANDRLRLSNHENPLSLMADETGGRAVFNHNDPTEALERIFGEIDSNYALGYYPPLQSRHPIRQVEVRLVKPRSGWRLSYRRSYILKTAERQLADRLFAALLLQERENPLGAELDFGPASEGPDRGKRTVPVEVAVPGSSLTLLPGASGETAEVRIFLFAQSEKGERTEMRQKTLTFDGATVQAGEPLPVVVNVDLPRGRSSVAVGIRDEASGRASYLVRDVTVP